MHVAPNGIMRVLLISEQSFDTGLILNTFTLQACTLIKYKSILVYECVEKTISP